MKVPRSAIGAIIIMVILSGGFFFIKHYSLYDFSINMATAPGSVQDEGGPRDSDGFNILILGIDTWEHDYSRSDMIMVANVDTANKKVVAVSIPRDTMVYVSEAGLTKINHAHCLGEIQGGSSEGTREAIEAVSNLLQIPLHYYVKVNFRGFRDFIDLIGGIDIELQKPVRLTFANVTLPAGKQHLDGDMTLEYVRERFSLGEGDFDRQKNQFQVIKAITAKLLSPEYFCKLPGLIKNEQEKIVVTNLSPGDILRLATTFKEVQDSDFTFCQIPGEPYYANDPLVKSRLYYWLPDTEKTIEISKKYLSTASVCRP